jgi:hypothetical protein
MGTALSQPEPTSLLLSMASRRTDGPSTAARSLFLRTIAENSRSRGVLFDRTEHGFRWTPTDAELIIALGGRLEIMRQGPSAPISAIPRALLSSDADWYGQFHDDDYWFGVPSVPVGISRDVSLVAPTLLVSSGGRLKPAHEWTTQHALFGVMRRDVFKVAINYLASAPSAWGGEDLAVLTLAGAAGAIVSNPDFTYVWDKGNWTSTSSSDSTIRYLQAQGWGNLASLSTYLLLQSIDRLAIFADADVLPEDRWLRGVRAVMETFWPVIDRRGHDLLLKLPKAGRRALIESRGTGRGFGRLSSVTRALLRGRGETLSSSALARYETGEDVVRSPREVYESLLPALAQDAPKETQPQIEFWRDRVGSVVRRYEDRD